MFLPFDTVIKCKICNRDLNYCNHFSFNSDDICNICYGWSNKIMKQNSPKRRRTDK